MLLVRSLPPPRLDALVKLVDGNLSDVLLTSNPAVVQQYVITLLQQLNVESSEADADGGVEANGEEDELAVRTRLRGELLQVMLRELPISDLQDVQQIAFSLYLITVSIVDQFLIIALTRSPPGGDGRNAMHPTATSKFRAC